MHIETLEKQLNQQQIQILNLKKAMKYPMISIKSNFFLKLHIETLRNNFKMPLI